MGVRRLVAWTLCTVLVSACAAGGAAPDPGDGNRFTVATVTDPARELAAAEEAFRSGVREPLRPALGDQADRTFDALDALESETTAAYLERLPTSEAKIRPRLVLAVIRFAIPLAQAEVVAGFVSTMASGIGSLGGSPGASVSTEVDDGSFDIEVTGDRVVATIDQRSHVDVGSGVGMDEHTTGTIEATMCPDSGGKVTVTIDVETQATVSDSAGGRVDHTLHVTGTATASVDDNAEITETTFDVTTGSARQQQGGLTVEGAGDSPESFVEVNTRGRAASGDAAWDADMRVTRSSSNANTGEAARLAQMSITLVNTVTKLVIEKAESLWKGGHCVEIILEGVGDQNDVDAGETLSFQAKVRHRFDGGDVDAKITASLSGDESLEPFEATSPVAYTYQAPDEDDQVATASLESRSRRGVATKDVGFHTGGIIWIASTGSGRLSVSGTVTDIEAPFSLSGTFQGGSATLNFVPSDAHGGTLSYTGGGSGATVSGQGTYTIEGDAPGPLSLSYTTNGCANLGTCAENKGVIILTPQQP